MNLVTVMKLPSAFLPVAMSFAAHIFQLLIAGQLPIVAFFAIKWLPRTPRQALQVLVLQAGAGLAALAPVFFLHL